MTSHPPTTDRKEEYIVVKTIEEAEALISKEVPPFLKGKYIIIAPNGLQFVPKEDIVKLPQIQKLLSQVKEEEREKTAKDICVLIDRLEFNNRISSMEEWKEYKTIRNAIRDRFINSKK